MVLIRRKPQIKIMNKLQQLQNQVKIVGNYLYNKDIKPPRTIEECRVKLNFYYFSYGVNYSKVIMSERLTTK